MIKKPSPIPLHIAIGVILTALVVVVFFRKPYEYHGTTITPPLLLSKFSLQTKNNEPVQLTDFKGKIVLLFFGYTSCPDVCPITLGTFKQVHERLGEGAQNVRFVMVTADPERDTPDKVAAYAARFNPEFIGLSGSLTDLQNVWKELGVFVEKQETESAAGYLVSHTTHVYVLDQNGSLIMTLPYGTSAIDMANDVNQLLKQSKQE